MSDVKNMDEKEKEECYFCDKEITDKIEHYGIFYHLNPWDEDTIDGIICIDCSNSGCEYETYFICETCNRNIANSNGRTTWSRYINEETICLKCLQEEYFENGIPKEKLKNNSINAGMFYNNSDLIENGFNEKETIFIRSKEPIIRTNVICYELSERYKVIVNFERLGYIGMEGTISIWIKEKDEQSCPKNEKENPK